MKKNSYQVTLLNQKFNLKTEDEEKHVRQVSDYVNKKIFDIQEKTPSVSSLSVALLAALNIADDYFKIQEKSASKKKQVREKIQGMISLVESQLGS